MSNKVVQTIVIILGILIILAFLAVIYGMYSKISISSNEQDNKIYTDLKNLWNKNEITIINDILNEMKEKNEDETNSLINAIDSIINIKDDLTNLLLTFDALKTEFRKSKISINPKCINKC